MEVGNRVGHPEAAFPVLRELTWCAHQLWNSGSERKPAPFDEFIRARLFIPLNQLGLVIEQVQMWRAAGHVQINDPIDLGGVMGFSRGQWIEWLVGGCASIATNQVSQSHRAHAELAGALQKVAPR